MNELIEKTNELLLTMQNQLHEQFEHARTNEYTFEEGRNYLKLVRSDDQGRSSVVGFIVKKAPKAIDNKTNQPFNVGDMLMAAGWSKPATNFARGNLFTGYSNVRWTGI
jgi:hypothetical protein|tara:strand:+ start:112 stop:438 length:327 start_codon:yes stop_codon:yes gene_type:complete